MRRHAFTDPSATQHRPAGVFVEPRVYREQRLDKITVSKLEEMTSVLCWKKAKILVLTRVTQNSEEQTRTIQRWCDQNKQNTKNPTLSLWRRIQKCLIAV